MFQEYKSFYYFDASIRIRLKLEHLQGVKTRQLPPVTLNFATFHSVYATTHPGNGV